MSNRIFATKKGLGTVLASAFFIGLLVISLILVNVFDAYQKRYLDVREEMIELDIDRIDEKLNINRIVQPSTYNNYTFDIIVSNKGTVPVSITRAYIYDNIFQNLTIYDRQNNFSELGLNASSCEIIEGDEGHAIKVNASSALLTSPYNRYRVVICTERGRQFSYSYLPVPTGSKIFAYGSYPIIIAAKDKNFEFTCVGVEEWTEAYYKPSNTARTLYRLWLNNTTNYTIHLHENSTMLQMSGKVGENYIRYIVSENSTSTPDSLISFSSQSIEPKDSTIVYFAATIPGGNEWADDPNPASTSWYLVGFMFQFNFEDDPEIRYISMPALPQELSK